VLQALEPLLEVFPDSQRHWGSILSSLATAYLQLHENTLAKTTIDKGLGLGSQTGAVVTLKKLQAQMDKQVHDKGKEVLDVDKLLKQAPKDLKLGAFAKAKDAYTKLVARYAGIPEPEQAQAEPQAPTPEASSEAGDTPVKPLPAPKREPSRKGSGKGQPRDLTFLEMLYNLAESQRNCDLVTAALGSCDDGLATVEALKNVDSIASGALADAAAKFQCLRPEIFLTDLLLTNYRSSLLISTGNPTAFSPDLATAIFSRSDAAPGALPTGSFFTGQFLQARYRKSKESPPPPKQRVAVGEPGRFLATVDALTSIVVFARARCPKSGKIVGFGAHVSLQNVLHGCMRQQLRSHRDTYPLQEFQDALKATFEGLPANAVLFHLVGGQLYEENNKGSSLATVFFPDVEYKHHFSWHVRDAIATAGFVDSMVNTVMLNPFPGQRIGSALAEQQLREQGQCLTCAALDLDTGLVVTHTEYATGRALIPPAWWEADKKFSSLYRPAQALHPMQSARALHAAPS
jgi:hypothetical protein